MLWSVDRLEGDVAVLLSDDGETLCVTRMDLPPVSEGDMLRKTEQGFIKDDDAARKRREQILRLQERLRHS